MEHSNLVGKKIQIKLHDRSHISKDITNKFFDSQISGYENGLIEIYAPIVKRNYLPLKTNQIIDVLYLNDENTKDSYEQFEAIVVQTLKKENFMIYALKHVKKKSNSQKREFFRLNFERNPSDISIEGNDLSDATLIDLSATGMRLKTNTNISIGDIFDINLNLQKSKILLSGKVVRVAHIDENKYSIAGLNFNSISPYEEDVMIKYMLNEQRKKIFFNKY